MSIATVLRRLFRRQQHLCHVSIIGHMEPDDSDDIVIVWQCRVCGKRDTTRHRMDDPYIDEDSRGHWSGYTWWMHDPLPAGSASAAQ